MILSLSENLGIVWSSAFLRTFEAGSAVAFHPQRPNVLACAARNCEVMIFNLSDPSDPEIHKQAGQSRMGGEITHLAWNSLVPGIIASTASNGVTVIRDLKAKEGQNICCQFQDPGNRQHVSSVCWSPTVATHIIVAYDDDRHPGFQLWDLRYHSQPLREFSSLTGISGFHTKGLTRVAWDQRGDGRLLLSTGKDARTICWVLDDGIPNVSYYGNFIGSYYFELFITTIFRMCLLRLSLLIYLYI